MKLLAIIFCLVVSVSAFAQKKDTIKAYTIYELLQQIKSQPGTPDPLVLLNDSVYKGNVRLINSSDIESVDVIKGDDAEVIYGPDAVHGAFLMKTKNYMEGGLMHPINIIPIKSKNSIAYIIDGMPASEEQVNTNDILIQQSITGKKLEEIGLYSGKQLDSVVVIVTKTAAKKAYQHKFGAFSKEYKLFVDLNNGNDYLCTYFLDGKKIDRKEDGFIIKLYNIPAEKIQLITIQAPRPVDSFVGLNVKIVTKK